MFALKQQPSDTRSAMQDDDHEHVEEYDLLRWGDESPATGRRTMRFRQSDDVDSIMHNQEPGSLAASSKQPHEYHYPLDAASDHCPPGCHSKVSHSYICMPDWSRCYVANGFRRTYVSRSTGDA